jgi:succinoglycan biosynthesis protein ExoA
MKTFVSIIVPCYNEETTIGLLLSAIAKQTYPISSIEVIIADGLSSDRTRSVIAGYRQENPNLQVAIIDNPKRTIPAALNTAISIAKGNMIIRVDAHSVPKSDYVERCVQALETGLGENVGGVWEIQPSGTGWINRAIAVATSHPLGVGDARYRYTKEAGWVDTVPFGAFRRELVDQIGGFDETLLANEDYEFNARVRQHGGKIWLDPAIRCVYFARANLRELGRQYWRYGFWKARMLLRYPGTLRWRQALPPVFVASLVVWMVLSPWLLAARLALGFELLVYIATLLGVGVWIALNRRKIGYLAGFPLAIATMHFCWGTGFIWSLIFR